MNEVATRQRVSWYTEVYQVVAIRNALQRRDSVFLLKYFTTGSW